MKLVIDTNVIVSGILKDKDPERVLLFAAGGADIEWIVTPAIVAEYREVLGRKKFKLPATILERWHAVFDTRATVITPSLSISFPRDQKDAIFLACAIAANADYFITGHRDFSEARKLLKTTIIPVAQFIKLVVEPLS